MNTLYFTNKEECLQKNALGAELRAHLIKQNQFQFPQTEHSFTGFAKVKPFTFQVHLSCSARNNRKVSAAKTAGELPQV